MPDFSDNFDEASDSLLKNHVPDVGVGWTWDGTNDDGFEVEGSAGTIFGNIGAGSQGVGCNAISPAFSSADQQVWFERDIATNAPNVVVAVRMVDENNLFGARHAGTGASGRRLSRVTGGTNTDLIMSTGGIANEWLKVKAEGTTISLWQAPAGAEPADPESDTNWTQIGLDQTGQTDHQTETRCGIATRSNHANRIRSFRASAIGGDGQTIELTAVTETVVANPLNIVAPKTINLEAVTEINTANGLLIVKPQVVDLIAVIDSETLAPLTITNPRTYTLGQVTEAEQLNPLSILTENVVMLGQVSESGIVHNLEIDNPRTYTLEKLTESESVHPLEIASPQTITIGKVTEINTANALVIGGDQIIQLTPVSETNIANALVIGQDRLVELGQVSETENLSVLTITIGASVPAGFIYISDASISVAQASASIAVSKAAGTIKA